VTNIEYVKLIAEMAREVNKEDPIDFGLLQIDDRRIWDLMASSVVERYLDYKDTETGTIMYLSTITKLVVENFVLNLKLQSKND
jgi:hypothetical protein